MDHPELRSGSSRKQAGLVVLYDGYCPVCRRSARIIRKMDILGIIELRKYQDFPLEKLPVSLERLGKRVQACDPELRVCNEGIFAFSSILIRIPPLFIPAVISFILGKLGIGQRFYDFISDNRYHLPFSGMSRILLGSDE